MLPNLVIFSFFGVFLILQTSVFSNIKILNGSADLVLLAVIAWSLQKKAPRVFVWGVLSGLMVTLVSALPIGVAVLIYTCASAMAILVRQRFWQIPLIAMLVVTLFATVLAHILSLVSLRVIGHVIPFRTALDLVTLPSIILNLILAGPVFAIMLELAKWLYPEELLV